MALSIAAGAPTLVIRRQAYETANLSRAAIDERLGLTADEFRAEGDLVFIGPIYAAGTDGFGSFVAELETMGLTYFNDFFELSGNWPDWLQLYAAG